MSRQNAWIVPGTVLRVVDGDTITADLDLGWGVHYTPAVIRLAEINCPESSCEAGKAAAARARELLPVGTEISVLSHQRDKYGRVLATVIARGVNIGSLMLDEGHAVAYRGAATPKIAESGTAR